MLFSWQNNRISKVTNLVGTINSINKLKLTNHFKSFSFVMRECFLIFISKAVERTKLHPPHPPGSMFRISPKCFAVQISLVTFLAVVFHSIVDFIQDGDISGTPTSSPRHSEEVDHSQVSQDVMAARANISANASHFVRTLGGVQMPKLIYGTAWKKERTAELVTQAVRAGFRGIDTACQPKHYYEPGVGAALKQLITEDGMKREDIFIQTKFTSLDGQDPNNIPYDKTAPLTTQVQQSLEASLRNLGTEYIDSLVMHSPMKTMDQTLQVWKVFEEFVDSGKIKQLGISNCYSINDFKKIFDSARVKPSVLQNRLYEDSHFDKEIRAFCKHKGIYYQSFWTLTANPHILESREVQSMAKRYQKTPAQMFFAYLTQTGYITPLTGTKNAVHMAQDLEVLDMPPLSQEESKIFDDFINS